MQQKCHIELAENKIKPLILIENQKNHFKTTSCERSIEIIRSCFASTKATNAVSRQVFSEV
ncbi:hypothetical protein C2I19_03515 [Chromobacterium alticapitis]|uniref:Uncharacterized protein n=1 Tax=Chromobacterium alticapitis TaxID=2073169 RepID=A0A2S5DKD1_9NEIS|nr:hypothetical protein C2I19_03515 [Chromobacterium alticapitis]